MFRSREPRVETSSIATLVGEERPVTSVAVSRTKHESLQRMATQRVSGSQHRFLVSDRAGANTPILPQLARQLTPAIKAAKNAVPSSGVHSAEAALASIRCKLLQVPHLRPTFRIVREKSACRKVTAFR